jgi:hypothetical protein
MILKVLITCFFYLTSILVHPYYVSVTELNYNEKDHSLEITAKIFTDDLEKTLEQNYHTKSDLINPKDKSATEKVVSAYLNKNLKILVNGKSVEIKLLGYEIEEDAVWCYLEARAPSVPTQIKIHNSILYDFREDQLNIIHVTVNGERKSHKLQNPESELNFSFK